MTKLDIINNGLLRCGQRPLQSTDEDSADARLINVLFDGVLEETLREGKFSSTLKRIKLVQTAADPLFQYSNSFQQPADSIRIVDCYDSRGEYNKYLYWELEGNLILSDAETLYCKYVYIPLDLTQLDASAAMAVSLKLAIRLAYPKTENNALVDSLLIEYEQIVAQRAKSLNVLESRSMGKFAEIDWIDGSYLEWNP